MNEKITVALLFGGRGYESEVSVAGAKFLLSRLDLEKFSLVPVYITGSGEWKTVSEPQSALPSEDGRGYGDRAEEIITDLALGRLPCISLSPTRRGGRSGLAFEDGFIPVDVVFPLLHGDFGEDGIIQGALENARLPFVGQTTLTSAILSDKAYTKLVADHLGIPTADWTLGIRGSKYHSLSKTKRDAEKRLGYPLFIKPTGLGSSVGAGAAMSPEGFDAMFGLAASLGNGRVLIERHVKPIKELECAYFSAGGKELFTNIGEIAYGGEFYDYEAKYSEDSSASVGLCHGLTDEIRNTILDYSRRLVDYFGIRDLCRIDFFLTEDGLILFNEINAMPGFTSSSLYPALLSDAGIDPTELISLLISEAHSRGA